MIVHAEGVGCQSHFGVYSSIASTSATNRSCVVEERGDHAEHGVTEAADVQDVVAVRGLRRRVRLQVDADQLRACAVAACSRTWFFTNCCHSVITPVEPSSQGPVAR